MNTKKKTRIVLPLAGGLGNQLFQYAMALNFQKSDYEVKLETELGHPRLNRRKEPEITSLFADETKTPINKTPKPICATDAPTNFILPLKTGFNKLAFPIMAYNAANNNAIKI